MTGANVLRSHTIRPYSRNVTRRGLKSDLFLPPPYFSSVYFHHQSATMPNGGSSHDESYVQSKWLVWRLSSPGEGGVLFWGVFLISLETHSLIFADLHITSCLCRTQAQRDAEKMRLKSRKAKIKKRNQKAALSHLLNQFSTPILTETWAFLGKT